MYVHIKIYASCAYIIFMKNWNSHKHLLVRDYLNLYFSSMKYSESLKWNKIDLYVWTKKDMHNILSEKGKW